MELAVNKKTLVNDIQKIFSESYPFLQLQFITSPEPGKEPARKTGKATPDHFTEQSVELNSTQMITINNNTTVAALLSDLGTIGLPAQLFRRSGNLLIGTSLTGDWTLERQNKEAALLETIRRTA